MCSQFGPLVFLVLMIMPAALPMLLDVMGKYVYNPL